MIYIHYERDGKKKLKSTAYYSWELHAKLPPYLQNRLNPSGI